MQPVNLEDMEFITTDGQGNFEDDSFAAEARTYEEMEQFCNKLMNDELNEMWELNIPIYTKGTPENKTLLAIQRARTALDSYPGYIRGITEPRIENMVQ